MSRVVVVAANSSWNVLNFRVNLLRSLEQNGYVPVVLCPIDDGSKADVERLGWEWFDLPVARSGLNPLADLRLLVSYYRFLRRCAPVAFLSFTVKPNIYGSLAARFLQIPAVPNISGLGTVFIKRTAVTTLVRRLYKIALKRAHAVLFQNPDDRALFAIEGLVRPEQSRLVPGSGIDLEAFKPAPLPLKPRKALLVARLLGDKGVREFAKAAQMLRPKLPHVEFGLLGGLDVQNRTSIKKAELNSWISEGAIRYLGHASDVRPFIRDASVVVLPSYREGVPRTLLEAAAMARPLIATDVPGCREVVRDGVNGFLCLPRDETSLADAMYKLLNLPFEERQRMGHASRSIAEGTFGDGVVYQAYVDLLDELATVD